LSESLVDDFIFDLNAAIEVGEINHTDDFIGSYYDSRFPDKCLLYIQVAPAYARIIRNKRSYPTLKAIENALSNENNPDGVVLYRNKRIRIYENTLIWATVLDFDKLQSRISQPLRGIVELMVEKYNSSISPHRKKVREMWLQKLQEMEGVTEDEQAEEQHEDEGTIDIKDFLF